MSVRHPIHVKIEKGLDKNSKSQEEKYIEKEIEIILKSGKSTHLQVDLYRDWSSFANSEMFRLLLVLLACTRSYQVSRADKQFMVWANIKKEAFHTSSFKLDEDYDKAIVPYQTEDFPLNVTAEIYLRFPQTYTLTLYIVHPFQ